MRYYKDASNNISAYYEHQPQPMDLTEISEADALSIANPPPTLDDLKALQIARINSAFDRAAQALTAGYPEAERLTWPTQQAEALAWGANNAAPTPYLDGIAVARDIDPTEMRSLTLAQVRAFQAASQYLVGTRQRLRDAVSAVTDPADAALTLTDTQLDAKFVPEAT